MAILLPTLANVRVLKTVLMGDFEMRSAHATEALAALMGFRSNSAYMATSNHRPDVTVYEVDFDAFEERVSDLGYDKMSAEYLRLVFKGINWADPVWRLFGQGDSSAQDTWFYECQRRKIPSLYIVKTSRHCSVHWDHISVDSEYDQMVSQAAEGEMGRVLFRTYQLIASDAESESFFDGSALVGKVTGLTESSARQIANSFALRLFPGNLRSAIAA